MSVGIIQDRRTGQSVMYCTTEDRAFGPVFQEEEDPQEFLDWLRASDIPWSVGAHVEGDGTDPRHYPAGELEEVVKHWRLLVEDGEA